MIPATLLTHFPTITPSIVLNPEDDPWTRRVLDRERAEADLETGRRIRAALLESPKCGETELVSWATFSGAASVAGGAFQDLSPRASGGVDVVLGDVQAKGIEAALTGVTCLNQVLRAMATVGSSGRLSSVLAQASRAVGATRAKWEPLPGLALARIDGDPLKLTHTGHVGVAIRGHDGSVFEPRRVERSPGNRSATIAESAVPLWPGDIVLISTDNLTGLARKNRRTFNYASWLGQVSAPTPKGLVADLARELKRWCPSGGAQDEPATFVAIGVKTPFVFVQSGDRS